MKPRKPSGPFRASRHKRRILGLQGAMILALALVVVRIQFVQQVFGPKLLADAKQVQQSNGVMLAARGSLLDSSGQPLAYDIPAYRFDIEVQSFHNLQKLANELSPALGVSSQKILPWLQTKAKWLEWPTPILEPAKQAIVKAMSSGHAQNVTFTSTEERFYPYGTFAANTLGYVNHQGVGQTGLEAEYNQQLAGTNGKYSFVRDGYGFPIQSTMHIQQPAVPGENVELTLDQTVQGFVENAMNKLVAKFHPEHAAIIVTNPNTGAILGMASRPTFNPNQYGSASALALNNNWAVNSAFEPGSTFKIMVLAAALATHSISLNQTFQSGVIDVAGSQIHDWNYWGWGKLTFQQALEYSSNVGFATIALRLGWPNMLKYLQAFGYTSPTGVDLPGEATSILFPKQSRGPVQLATSGFGQGIAVTPMQQVAAVGAIANGGKLMKPYLAKAFINPTTGKVIKTVNPTVVNPQVVPKSVAQAVSQTMVLDVSKGIDQAAYLKGYDLAGKTGTAQVVNPKTGQYSTSKFITSFIGYAPGWDPQVEVYVTVDKPHIALSQTWGSTVAAPTARDIIQECLQYYHIQPRVGTASTASAQAKAAQTTATQYVQTPNVEGLSYAAAQAQLRKAGLQSVALGGQGLVKNQWPAPGISVPVHSKLYFWSPALPGQPVKMPDLSGTTMREAGDILALLGLNMQPRGDGFASSQSIPAGQTVHSGETVSVGFSPPLQVGSAASGPS
ncbi:PASTA domain-containing protein [Alicyclobacillus tolerans]|uniref:PASTA domain-containing penicillin-binding protein n=1 Tax=Alicyclobacillus tolerans TaxID=90970 RepID=UPI001F20A52D|nr:PASTA domain-containing penicillin-binding protein [Alicyclobacillus tolerans]MCF8564483.1 PASTA domain-containing protein [Alicyclobacillus tolerans]